MNWLFFQYLIFAIWLISLSLTLIWIKRSNLDNLTRAIWTLIVLLFPYLGAIAFIIVHRLGSRPPSDRSDP